MRKAPLLVIDGKLGRFGGAVNTKVEGTGAITKAGRGGEYRLSAMLTATQAHKMEELAKKVPVEEEARTRARAGVLPYAGKKEGEGFLPRHSYTKTDSIPISKAGGVLTYAGHGYLQERQHVPARPRADRYRGVVAERRVRQLPHGAAVRGAWLL